MQNVADSFRRAVALYAFPRDEPIYYVPASTEAEHEVVLFRPAGPIAERYQDLSEFWASALYNYLEDRLSDGQFGSIGEGAEYILISANEAEQLTLKLGFCEECFAPGVIAFPTLSNACTLAESRVGLNALIGSDASGHFALIWMSAPMSRRG